jgi:hypothetical protein
MRVQLDPSTVHVAQDQPLRDTVGPAHRHQAVRVHPPFAPQPARGEPALAGRDPRRVQHHEQQGGEARPQDSARGGEATGSGVDQHQQREEQYGAADCGS